MVIAVRKTLENSRQIIPDNVTVFVQFCFATGFYGHYNFQDRSSVCFSMCPDFVVTFDGRSEILKINICLQTVKKMPHDLILGLHLFHLTNTFLLYHLSFMTVLFYGKLFFKVFFYNF